jgi:hypothetical protein
MTDSARASTKNPEAESFFAQLSAHDDVGTELLAALKPLGEYQI